MDNRKIKSELSDDENQAGEKKKQKKKGTGKALRSTIGVLLVAAACMVLVANLWLPVLKIYGSSMSPALNDGDYVVCVKTTDLKTGDIIGFYYNNRILVKRVIAGPGDLVDISDDGVVSVNGEVLDEPYISKLALGNSDIEYPYQVPDNHWFVLGDHRSVSMDSRTKAIGPIAEEQIIGKLEVRFWPFNAIDFNI